MGDWDGRIGKDASKGLKCIGQFGEELIPNSNGKKMLEFCIINNVTIDNSFWLQPWDEKYTFVAEEREARSILYITFS